MKNLNQYIVLLLFVGFSQNLIGQDLGLYFMNNVWQSNKLNPSSLTEQKFIFSFPSITASAGTSGINYNKIVTTNAEGLKVINADDLINQLEDQNHVWTSLDVETFNLAFGIKDLRFFVSHAVRSNLMATFPKDLAEFALQGNGQFLGEELNIAPRLRLNAYSELAIGGAIKLSKVTLGAKIKLLGGIGNVSTKYNRASIHTDDAGIYDLTLTSEYEINAAGAASFEGLDSPGGSTVFEILDSPFGQLLFGNNTGIGLDLGATFEVNDNLTLSASMIDMGTIGWNKNVQNYKSKGTYVFNGFDAIDVIDDADGLFNQVGDTLSDIFSFQSTNNKYSTSTPMRTYLGAQYKFAKIGRVGALLHTRHINGQTLSGIAINGGIELGKILSVGVVVSHAYSSTNLGLNGALKLGPVQLFASSDNILAVTNPTNHNLVHARLGMNLVFK